MAKLNESKVTDALDLAWRAWCDREGLQGSTEELIHQDLTGIQRYVATYFDDLYRAIEEKDDQTERLIWEHRLRGGNE